VHARHMAGIRVPYRCHGKHAQHVVSPARRSSRTRWHGKHARHFSRRHKPCRFCLRHIAKNVEEQVNSSSQQVKRRPGRAGCHHDVVTCEDTVRWGQSDGEGVQTTACMILFIIHEAKSKNGNVSTTYYIILIVCGPFIRHCYAQGRM
jgi:hypothetical protein